MVFINDNTTQDGPSGARMFTTGSSVSVTSSACRPMLRAMLWSRSWYALWSMAGGPETDAPATTSLGKVDYVASGGTGSSWPFTCLGCSCAELGSSTGSAGADVSWAIGRSQAGSVNTSVVWGGDLERATSAPQGADLSLGDWERWRPEVTDLEALEGVHWAR